MRRWVLKFGPAIARELRRSRPAPDSRWHLDEMVVRIAGERMYLWRAVDHEGEILDMLVQRAIRPRRSDSCASCCESKVLLPRCWSLISCPLTALLFGSSGCIARISKVSAPTIGRKIHSRW